MVASWSPDLQREGIMFGAVVFTYGMLMSFVLSGAARNRKAQRPNPKILEFVGLVLCGVSVALSVSLFGYAAMDQLAG